MINQLKLINIQSHKKSILDFHPGLNVIVGPTDSGKSAIIRALRWLAWNRPLGDDIRSDWGGKSKVSVTLDGGEIISKIKDDSQIYKHSEFENPFKAFGTDVPEEIQKTLNLNMVNLQMQLDPTFLLSMSEGEIAKYFNKIANLEKIDKGISFTNSGITRLNSSIKNKTEDLAKAEAKLTQFDELPKLEIELEVLEEMESKIENKQKSISSLEALINKIGEIEEEILESSEILAFEEEVDKLINSYGLIVVKNDEIEELQNLISDISEIDDEIAVNAFLVSVESDITNLINIKGSIDSKNTEIRTLSALVDRITSIDVEISTAKKELEKNQAIFDQNMPEVCPLCGK